MDIAETASAGAAVRAIFGGATTLRVAASLLFTLSPLDGELSSAAQASDIVRIAKASGEADLTGPISKWPTVQSCIEPRSELVLEPYWREFDEKAIFGCAFSGSLNS
ncbi:hypothetical protein A4U53_005335 (plasmid) [Rhizobium ruizarguesonis]|uniref:Uncharacterized protein n=1 Tax=Rhizobium ruizarguesonis TaxID=2081791 RepID=A0ACD5EH25_9HYPH